MGHSKGVLKLKHGTLGNNALYYYISLAVGNLKTETPGKLQGKGTRTLL